MTQTRHDIEPGRRRALGLLLAAAAVVTAGCGTTGGPVPDGYYRVERGDTLYSIARKHRRSVRDLTRWNSDITSPSQIEVGQLVRVRPPGGASGSASAGQAVTDTPRVDSGTAARPPASSIRLQWPADGRVTAGFSPPASKGLSIAVPANGTVRAAGAGRAIHVGNLRGYGMLVIVKHSDDWLTVYGNLDQPLVAEGAQVSAGQDVGRMGASPSELHFEVRGNGKPVDPAAYLPSRG
ncbi:peptidoglycan DD-metalloendopeptidase family protein [Cupriavidus sp. UYPR2.512]|uniref:peptidoglycan DD-metalloendopeptidase family protein n=1 Tax=Cupriavidus sp. UYPR2.512 TaxID=1080187 RepID=UPI00036ED812|nr:peptidoglycan DD-metalloendopeptidase family protein [Cupriavidus sp. UYPR2.512]UIF87175.1 peptidoglycan DD-metalloendopeptidase family protein [Cupriavidus necator]